MGQKLLIVFIALFPMLLSGQDYLFEINDFKAHEDDLNTVGNALLLPDRMRLTSAEKNQVGACWFTRQKIYLEHGFETEFTFLISETDTRFGGGDGFAFVMQSQGADAIGGEGDNIGYKEIPYVLAIEFDLKNDQEGSRNHINLSFLDDSRGGYRRYATVHEIPEITDGKSHFTRIVYQDGFLRVFLDSYLFPVLSVKIDIGEKIRSTDDYAWLGFTSATSDAYANHDLLQWNVKQYPPPPEKVNDSITISEKAQIIVQNRKVRIQVWDHNTIDGDVISLKWGDEWLLSEYELQAEKKEIKATLTGFQQKLVLYANNTGQIPPNTVAINIFDGFTTQRVQLEGDLKQTESIVIQYGGPSNDE